MKIRSIAIVATIAAIEALPSFVPVEAAAQAREATTPAFQEAIPNIPGKSLIGLVVSYPPGGKSPAHTHAGSAFIVGYVLSGSIRSQGMAARYRCSTLVSTGLSRLARITRSVRTRVPLNLRACSRFPSPTPPMPGG